MLRVLSLSCVYPNPSEPGLGLFVRSRLQHMAASADLRVIAPVAALDYAHLFSRTSKRSPIPNRRTDGPLEVFHPRWLYPPLGTLWNALCLFCRLAGPVRRLRREFPFQLIDAHFGFPEGVAAAFLARFLGSPFTVTLRGNEPMHARSRWRRSLMAWTLQRAACTITVSERLRQFAVSLGADPGRVHVIPNGIDAGVFFPRDRLECRRKHGIPPHGPVILSAGSLIERKGHHHLIGALRGLSSQGIQAHVMIAGGPGREGHYDLEIRRLLSDPALARRVRLLGWVPPQTMAELMSAADLLCLASTREGWPNVVAEALACGTPVVASDVGAVPDLISSPEHGFVVPPGDQPALERALARAVLKQWDRGLISQRAQARTWDQVAREVVNLMQQVAEESKLL